MSLSAIKGDITELHVDAVVNAANESLLGGGGVDGAIHWAAGPELLEECRSLDGCPTGKAKITAAYKLPCRHVIHTVGPIWQGGEQGEAQLLESCYRSSLELAVNCSLHTIAFPAISCGVYGYPIELAATTAIGVCREYEDLYGLEITFCLFSDSHLGVYQKLLLERSQKAPKISFEKRIQGSLLGAALGDALGVPVECVRREFLKKNPLTGMQGGGTHNQPLGTWSDDTSLILCTLQSLLEKGYDLQDMMHKFSLWRDKAYLSAHGEVFDIGHATEEALRKYSSGAPREEWGCCHDWQNGNASLLRILPLSLFVWKEPAGNAIEKSFLCSSLTHSHIRSQISCAYYTLMIRSLLDGSPLKQALRAANEDLRSFIPESEEKHFIRLLDETIWDCSEDEISSSGYVVHTLEAALYCVNNSGSFTEAVLLAVNLGDDSDATACVTGALAGLLYGVDAIKPSWLSDLAGIDMLRQMADNFSIKVLSFTA